MAKGMGCKLTPDIEKYQVEFKTDKKEYIRKIASGIFNQGSMNCCVSTALKELYYFKRKFNPSLKEISDTWIFEKRHDKNPDGMQVKDGLDVLKENKLIKTYASLKDIISVKAAIVTHGGVLLALKVKSDDNKGDFWNGSKTIGYHAVAAIGFDEEGIIFKNSWGMSYGKKGLYRLPYKDFYTAVKEAWTILE